MQPKLRIVVSTVGLGLTGSALAQSAVTLYGIVDQSVRYTTSTDSARDGNLALTNGAITNSRWGLKGDEDLGGGLKALFLMEGGFDPQTGQLNQGGRLFGRYAYAGLSGSLGTVTLGRRGTEAFNLFGDFDPLTVGNYTANAWPFFMTVGRINHTVAYTGRFGGLTAGATYGFGQQPGRLGRNNYWGVRASYAAGQLRLGGTYQEMRDLGNGVQRMWGLGARYAAGSATLSMGYMGGRDATGFVDSALNDPNRTIATGSFSANPRKDMTLFAGVTWQAAPSLAITGALYFGAMKNLNGLAGTNGKRYTGVWLAEHALSKRTQLYATVDHNRVTGGAGTELPGAQHQTGIALGIRHSF